MDFDFDINNLIPFEITRFDSNLTITNSEDPEQTDFHLNRFYDYLVKIFFKCKVYIINYSFS